MKMNYFKGLKSSRLCFSFLAKPLITHAFVAQALIAPAWADDFRLKFVPNPNPKEVISALKWDEGKDTQEPILQSRWQTRDKEKEGSTHFVKLQGSFKQKDRTLLFENQPIPLNSD